MKKLVAVLVLSLVCIGLRAQVNIVQNGDFEYYTPCPTSFSQTSNCTGWRQYSSGTSDFMHTCATAASNVQVPNPYFGYQWPASGLGYLGGYSFTGIANPAQSWTEYVAGSIAPLTIGTTYEVSMSVSLSNKSQYGNNGLGMWFYDNGPTTVAPSVALAVTPQLSWASAGVITDTQNWVRLSAKFTADSAYDNIVIGMFIPASGLLTTNIGGTSGFSYYFYDSVWIRIATGINNLYADSAICAGVPFQVPFTLNSGTVINPGNVYTAYLSDPTGSFTNGTTVIGTLNGTGAGSITCVVPATVQPGPDYRIRIMSSNKVDSSDPNIKKIAVGIYPYDLKAAVDTPVCEGDAIHLYASSNVNGVKYSWTGPNGYTSNKGDNSIPGAKASQHDGRYIVTASSYQCIVLDTVDMKVKKYPDSLKATGNTPVCLKNTITLAASTTSPGTVFKWTGPCGFASSDSISKIPDCKTCHSGIFHVIADRNGCKKTLDIDIKVINAVVDLGQDEILCMKETKVLKLDVENATFEWQDGSRSPEYTVTKPGIYWVIANTQCGLLTDSVYKDYELCECKPFVPDAFTPNGDGKNDKVGSWFDCKLLKYEMMIFNRFGENVFRTTDLSMKWDGMYKNQPADVGTYFYQIRATGPRKKELMYKGDIILIR